MRYDKGLSRLKPVKRRKPAPTPAQEWKITTDSDGELIVVNTVTGEERRLIKE